MLTQSFLVDVQKRRLLPTSLVVQELLPHAQRCRSLIDGVASTQGLQRPPLLMINGHVDVAVQCGADGVHLPEAMVDRAPGLLTPGQGDGAKRLVVGASVHSVVRAEGCGLTRT